MNWLNNFLDWLEDRPLSQFCVGLILAFLALLILVEALP